MIFPGKNVLGRGGSVTAGVDPFRSSLTVSGSMESCDLTCLVFILCSFHVYSPFTRALFLSNESYGAD